MDYVTLTSLALLATIIFLSTKLLLRNPNSPKPPPSPPCLPYFGHLHLLKEPFHRRLESLSRRYGPVFTIRFGKIPFLVITSPEAAEQCLTSQNDVAFANRPQFVFGEVVGYNFTTVAWASYGDLWRSLRRVMTIEAFNNHQITNNSKIRLDEARSAARNLLSGSGNPVDLNGIFFGYTKNVVMRMMVGKKWDPTWARGDIFGPSKFMSIYDFFPVLRWSGIYPGLEKEMRTIWVNRDRFLQWLIDEARKEMKEGVVRDSKTMVDELLVMQKSEPEFYSDSIIKGILVVMLSAGTDTSARTMEWAISLLLNNPEKFKKARSEIDERVGSTRLVEDSDLQNLPYLRCVVNETLRMFPVAPLLVPHCSGSDTVISGYRVKKGTVLLINAWAIQRDPRVWEDPLEFKPERFEGGESGFAFKFIPFGVGRRGCPGLNLAMRLMMLALATCIQCFEFENSEGGAVNMEESGSGGITITKTENLHAVVKPRDCVAHLIAQL